MLLTMVNGIGVLATIAAVLLSASPFQDVRGESKAEARPAMCNLYDTKGEKAQQLAIK